MKYSNQLSFCMAIFAISILANPKESEAFTMFGDTIHVKLTNRLSDNKKILVHCKSNDDDLGDHWLNAGESYGFKFGESVFWTTEFFCGFTFDGLKHWGDAYTASENDCKEHCWWEIKESGPCLYKDGKYTECTKWNLVQQGRRHHRKLL